MRNHFPLCVNIAELFPRPGTMQAGDRAIHQMEILVLMELSFQWQEGNKETNGCPGGSVS